MFMHSVLQYGKIKKQDSRIAVPPHRMHNGIPVYDGMARSGEDPEMTVVATHSVLPPGVGIVLRGNAALHYTFGCFVKVG
jgi:hypothetical protein